MSNYAIFIKTYPNLKRGTGVIFDIDTTADYSGYTLITNKHLFKGADSIDLIIQLTNDEKMAVDTITKTYHLYSDSKDSLFVVHDSLDIVALYIDMIKAPNQKKDLKLFSIKPHNIINFNDIHLGQSVIFFGYPMGIKLNGYRPLLRKGIVAGCDKQPQIKGFESIIYLDAQVYGGSSGSPVFLDPDYDIIGVKYFIGIVAASIDIRKYELSNIDHSELFYFQENIGIGIIMPIEKIVSIAERAKAIIR